MKSVTFLWRLFFILLQAVSRSGKKNRGDENIQGHKTLLESCEVFQVVFELKEHTLCSFIFTVGFLTN